MIPAFPRQLIQVDNREDFDESELCPQSGMTLRDYFAAKALPAIINEPSMASDFGRDFIARQAYLMADAMLKARG